MGEPSNVRENDCSRCAYHKRNLLEMLERRECFECFPVFGFPGFKPRPEEG